MNCALSLFGGSGIYSFMLYSLFIATILFLVILYYALKEAREEIGKLRERIDSLEEMTKF